MSQPDPSSRAPYSDYTEPPKQRMTFDEYVDFAAAHPGVFEYIGGFVYAKGLPKKPHARAAGNIFGHLWVAARASGCRAYADEGAVMVGEDMFRPDVLIACGPPSGEDWEPAPCLVVEVLSPGTALTDRTTKRLAYTSLPSLQAYWIVSQDWRSVERHWRDRDGAWQFDIVRGDGALDVPCPPRAPLTLDEVYEGLDVPHAPPPPRRVREPEPAGA